MSDIKERLRNSNIHMALKNEAADYIEQLEKDSARLAWLHLYGNDNGWNNDLIDVELKRDQAIAHTK